MWLEILGSRLLAPFFGSTVYVWGALLSVFMGGLSCGYAWGGWLADRRRRFSDLTTLFRVAAVLALVLPLAGKAICSELSAWDAEPRWLALLASTLIFFVPCALLGAVSPYLAKLAFSGPERVGTLVGNLYAIATVGSVAGALFSSFYLVAWLETSRGIMLLAVPLWLCSLLCRALDRQQAERI